MIDADVDAEESPLKQAPHTASARRLAAPVQPGARIEQDVAQIDAAYGDRNLTCTCPPLNAYKEST